MIGNALFATAVIFLALGLALLQTTPFLIPYRAVLWQDYALPIGVFAAVLFGNVLAAALVVSRRLLLKSAGAKLAHVEKQLHSGGGISADLARRIADRS